LYYYLLTGTPPYTGSPQEVFAAHKRGGPRPPAELVAGVPPEVDAVILTALDTNPAHRQKNIRDFITAVEETANHLIPDAIPEEVSAPVEPQLVTESEPVTPEREHPPDTMVGLVAPENSRPLEAQNPSYIPTFESAPYAAVAAPMMAPRPEHATEPLGDIPLVPPAMDKPPADDVFVTPEQSARFAAETAGKRTRARSSARKGKFRETLWFKKGELDAVAARAAAQAARRGGTVPDKADLMPIEDRYQDDGTLTASDEERLSLRTGSTVRFRPHRRLPNEVTEDEIVRELSGGRRILFICIGVGLLGLVGVLFALFS
jgi:hypothetical protein